MSKLGFVIPVLNNYHQALELVDSIKTDQPHRIYIGKQFYNQVPLSQVWNDGFDRAVSEGADYIFILNDDILFGPDGVDNMVKEYERLKDEGVVLLSANNIKDHLAQPSHILTMSEPYQPGSVSDHPNYSCFMVGKDFFDKVGRFDENFNPAWCEDQDSHQRITLLGYRAVCTTAASCVHYGSVTTKLLGGGDSSKSVAYFWRKWGSQNPSPPQAYAHPYNDPNMSAKDWIENYEM